MATTKLKTKEEKWNESDYPLHMRGDVLRRNDNLDQNKELCDRCDGTGNEFFSMYHKCPKCDGHGIKI